MTSTPLVIVTTMICVVCYEYKERLFVAIDAVLLSCCFDVLLPGCCYRYRVVGVYCF